MIKKLLLGLVLLISLVSSYSYTNISTCQTINSSFSWYDSEREIRLNDSLVSNGTTTCLSLNINNIILNCQSNSIDGNGSTSVYVGAFSTYWNNITIKNSVLNGSPSATTSTFGAVIYNQSGAASIINNVTIDSNDINDILTRRNALRNLL